MSLISHLMCWMSSGLLLCSCGVAAGDSGLSFSSLKTNSSSPVGLRGYRRYFANDSLIGRPVPCTRDDKICFRYNLVFDPGLDRCEPLGRYYSHCPLWANRTEFENGSGRIVGKHCWISKYSDPCPGYRMAYDSICYKKEVVSRAICGQGAYLTHHLFGNIECRTTPAIPVTVQQPEEDGVCVIPDLRFPDTERRVFFNNPFAGIQGFQNHNPDDVSPIPLECTSDQAACFAKRKVFVPEYEGCHLLHQQGPCTEDHIVALDAQAATQGRAVGTCVHVRGGCPRGHKRLIFDGECHEDREIAIAVPQKLILDQFGNYIVLHHFFNFFPRLGNNSCTMRTLFIPEPMGAIPLLFPPCGTDNTGWCKLYEVVNEAPQPEI